MASYQCEFYRSTFVTFHTWCNESLITIDSDEQHQFRVSPPASFSRRSGTFLV